MRAEVLNRVEHVRVTLSLAGVEPKSILHNRAGGCYLPETAMLTYCRRLGTDEWLCSVMLSGRQLRKNGTPGEIEYRDRLPEWEKRPQWLRNLIEVHRPSDSRGVSE